MVPDSMRKEGNIIMNLTRARSNIRETEEALEKIDGFLEHGILAPRDDIAVARAVGITIDQLGKVREYIITGRVSLDLGDCSRCQGWGRWDDIVCGGCGGTGSASATLVPVEEH
jgi:hypothetical protein